MSRCIVKQECSTWNKKWATNLQGEQKIGDEPLGGMKNLAGTPRTKEKTQEFSGLGRSRRGGIFFGNSSRNICAPFRLLSARKRLRRKVERGRGA